MILCVSNIYCEAGKSLAETHINLKLEGAMKVLLTQPSTTLGESIYQTLSLFLKWLGIAPIYSGPQYQDATHFWMPAHSMICVSWDTPAPGEADSVKVPRTTVRYKAPQSTYTHTMSRGSQTHSGPITTSIPRLLHAHTHSGRQ